MFCLVYGSVFKKILSHGLNGTINNCICLGYLFFKFYYATQYYQALTFISFYILICLEYKYFLKNVQLFENNAMH